MGRARAHSPWTLGVAGRGTFEVHWIEQKHKGMEDYKVSYTLGELRSFADHLDHILNQIHRFHGGGELSASLDRRR